LEAWSFWCRSVSILSGSVEGTLRVGFQNSPPYHFPDAQNHPTGPAVEIIKRAAQERNIHLEWVFSPEGPERALSGPDWSGLQRFCFGGTQITFAAASVYER
jgi:hypothetical protein